MRPTSREAASWEAYARRRTSVLSASIADEAPPKAPRKRPEPGMGGDALDPAARVETWFVCGCKATMLPPARRAWLPKHCDVHGEVEGRVRCTVEVVPSTATVE